jgi:hypothetical protein
MSSVFSTSAVTIVEAVTSYINNTGFLLLPAVGTRLILMESYPAPPHPVVCENHMGTIIIGKASYFI